MRSSNLAAEQRMPSKWWVAAAILSIERAVNRLLREVRRGGGPAQNYDVVWHRRQFHPGGDDGLSDLPRRPHAGVGLDGRTDWQPQSLCARRDRRHPIELGSQGLRPAQAGSS